MWACGGSDARKESPRTVADVELEFASTLSASDTTRVLALGAEVLDSIKAGNVQWAVGTLCELDSAGSLRPLSESKREMLGRRFQNFPVKDYELDYYRFSLPSLNDLKYRTYFVERDADGKGGAAMGLMFNPVKESGEWYLCLKEADQPASDAANALDPNLIIEGK